AGPRRELGHALGELPVADVALAAEEQERHLARWELRQPRRHAPRAEGSHRPRQTSGGVRLALPPLLAKPLSGQVSLAVEQGQLLPAIHEARHAVTLEREGLLLVPARPALSLGGIDDAGVSADEHGG